MAGLIVVSDSLGYVSGAESCIHSRRLDWGYFSSLGGEEVRLLMAIRVEGGRVWLSPGSGSWRKTKIELSHFIVRDHSKTCVCVVTGTKM